MLKKAARAAQHYAAPVASQYAQHYAAPVASQYAQHYATPVASQYAAPPQYPYPQAYAHPLVAPGRDGNVVEAVVQALVLAFAGICLIRAWRAFPLGVSTVTNPLMWGRLFDVRGYLSTLFNVGMSLVAMAAMVLYCSSGDPTSVVWRLVPNLLPGVGTLLSGVLLVTRVVDCVQLTSLVGALTLAVLYGTFSPHSAA